MKKIRTLITLWLGLTLILAACRPAPAEEATESPLSPEAVYTAAAETANARMTEIAASTPSPLPPTPTDTAPPPTDTSVPGTPTETPVNTPVGGGIDLIEFVADVSVPDGTTYQPGERFTKTWRLRNIGTTTWSTEYALVFDSGTQMGAPAAVPFTQNVPAGQTVDLSVELVAPADAGSYWGFWKLRNAAGASFGLGPAADTAFYVQINVSGGSAATTAAPGTTTTPGATTQPTATTSSSSVVSNVTLSVDEATVEATCPHTFNFTASFTLSQAATVTYRLEAETGFEITLPDPTTTPLDSGTHTVNYTLEFSDSVTGTARFHVTSPRDVNSSQVSFELDCQ